MKIILKHQFLQKFLLIILVVACGIMGLFWLSYKPIEKSDFVAKSSSGRFPVWTEPIQPIPMSINLNQQQVQLGRKLFHDVRLSQDNSIACVSCHYLSHGGTDHLVHSIGVGGKEGVINAPTVLNSSYNFKQFWDGRANTLEAQIDGPLFSPEEMANSSWLEIINKLQQSPDYVAAFKQAYPDGITAMNIKSAIATFEKSLTTPNSRFDQFLRGNKNSINEQEKKGYYLFKAYGCVTCHQGTLVGGNMFQTLGLFGNYFKDRQQKEKAAGQVNSVIERADLGRYNITHQLEDRHVFKVPTLRNIVLTSPYFHDGSVPTLEAAIKLMAQYQLGREIPQDDIDLMMQFLNTLTGELPH